VKNLIKRILSTPLDPASLHQVLDEFNQSFDLTASCILSYNELDARKSNFTMSSLLRAHMTPQILAQAQSSEDDAQAYLALMQMPPQVFYTEHEALLAIGKENTDPSFIRKFCLTIGIVDRLASRLNNNGPWMDCLIIYTGTDTMTRRVSSDATLSLMAPIISGALTLGRYTQALRSKYNAVLGVLDGLGLGVFLIHPSGNVIEHNSEAQRILDLKDGLYLSSDKVLKASSYDKNAELNEIIKCALGCFNGDHQKKSRYVSITRPSKAYDYLISAKPLYDALAELEENLMCAFVIVIDPSRKKSLSAEGLTLLGGLSQAESQIVNLMIKGLRPADVAQRRDVSINTIKTQLKGISRKLNCSSQSDLIRVAAATRIPIEEI